MVMCGGFIVISMVISMVMNGDFIVILMVVYGYFIVICMVKSGEL